MGDRGVRTRVPRPALAGDTMRFLNPYTSPITAIRNGEAVAIKIVAVAGQANDWAAYYGPTDWSDERIADVGDKMMATHAKPIFPHMHMSGRLYRR